MLGTNLFYAYSSIPVILMHDGCIDILWWDGDGDGGLKICGMNDDDTTIKPSAHAVMVLDERTDRKEAVIVSAIRQIADSFRFPVMGVNVRLNDGLECGAVETTAGESLLFWPQPVIS